MDDPDIAAVGAMGEFLYIRALLLIRRNRSYGRIPKRSLGDFGDGIPNARKHAQSLVEVGLWIDEGSYWLVRNWDKWNMTQAEVDQRSEQRREAGRLGGHNSKHSSENPSTRCALCWKQGWNGSVS
ncbi:MAG: hypothetical protein LBV06_08395 [Propionibacteriaceae bacterium]|nr:hypothetical protein [Propionibacteriaceae bacterium]